MRLAKITTVIGADTQIEGDLVFSGSVHVDGKIHGNVIAEKDEKSTLILSERGLVEGDVRVPHAFLNGRVVGDVRASQRVELDASARVTGTLYYRLLEMAMGAEVNGQLVCTEEVRGDPGPTTGADATQHIKAGSIPGIAAGSRAPLGSEKDNS